MTDDRTFDVIAKTPEQLASLRQITLVIYILYALSWLIGISAIVAIVINYVKREDAAGTLYESHFTWQIRTFWWALLWSVIGVLSMVILIGFVILFATAVWSIYRIVKGWLYWSDRKPMPV
ncbi:DUF4870 family protein [Tepidicella baoligensis]|uniref:DUF4870 family protein n=1 Tax=Tepidicella baoligensis TaxID=2707016 RepID=UPI0015DAF40B|nr:hypothetical protein [Tepidicella baoligensis]